MGARENIAKLLMGKLGGAWEGGIRAYHSSPHDFDKFDWSKLRTGEGGNMYGAGFYAAENPAVSGQGGQYWKQFANRMSPAEWDAAIKLEAAGFDREKALAEVQRRIASNQVTSHGPNALESLLAQRELFASDKPVGPRTYEVNIAARPELLLDWDKPLKQQQQAVQEVAHASGIDPTEQFRLPVDAPLGMLVGHKLKDPNSLFFNNLRDAGIPGIRYLDQGSRNPVTPEAIANLQASIAKKEAAHQANPWLVDAEKNAWGARNLSALDEEKRQLEQMLRPTYNYVVTDPSKLDILAKYGLVGTAAGGMGALAAQDQYGAEAQQ